MKECKAASGEARIRTVVVDDTPEVLECIVELIQNSGVIEVIATARNGFEALHLTTALKPDLVLMDVNMPVMDGFSSAREIKGILPGLQVVLMSAESSPALRDMATHSGADQFVSKAELLLGTSLLLA